MEGYEVNVSKWIAREIHDRFVGTDTTIVFPFLLTRICLDEGDPEILGVDQFIHP